ncbi:MAG TPA: single-stranded DNA-binding protein [Alphaproteobacteria bacterium]|nr:single-stranded DNA-binding protein [Alphaproteobacteria bacterium]
MAKSLNKVMLIGNLTRDPEMKYTPSGAAVTTFGIATNRTWTTDTGEKKDDVDFHNIVAWNKLAEICAQLLKKGRKVYVEGRLSTSTWQAPDGAQRNKTEIVINDMVILDRKMDEPAEVEITEPVEPASAKATAGRSRHPSSWRGPKTRSENPFYEEGCPPGRGV